MYGDQKIPPFPKDLLPPVAVASSLDEITPPDAPVASTDPVLAIDASDSVQQDLPCLPTSTSWDHFLPDMIGLFVELYIEDVGDIINDIFLLFVEANSSSIAIVIGPT